MSVSLSDWYGTLPRRMQHLIVRRCSQPPQTDVYMGTWQWCPQEQVYVFINTMHQEILRRYTRAIGNCSGAPLSQRLLCALVWAEQTADPPDGALCPHRMNNA